jgi:predicted nucleotidyltransferase
MAGRLDEKTKKVLAYLQEVSDELEIAAYLIGGQARNLWFLDTFPQPPHTRDIDWVVGETENEKLEALKMRLLADGFIQTPNPSTLISPEKVQIDISSFQDSEREDEPFLALREIYDNGIASFYFEGKNYHIATVPAIILLKLIAWHQRPEHRMKDIEHISYMLQYYDIYNDDGFLLFTELETDYIGARIIGRKIKYILSYSPDLKQFIAEILTEKSAKIAQIMARGTNIPESKFLAQLKELLTGVCE